MNAAARSRPLWLVLAGGFLLLLLFVIAVRLLTGLAPAPDEDAARAAERAKAHQELEAENTQKLQNYAWVDKAKGTVQIPIGRAMELAIVELNSKKPAAAGPIATPAPSPAASPAGQPAGSTSRATGRQHRRRATAGSTSRATADRLARTRRIAGRGTYRLARTCRHRRPRHLPARLHPPPRPASPAAPAAPTPATDSGTQATANL